MYSLSEENYLKAIYHLEQQAAAEVSTNAIAERMQTKASSVTDMIKKLADKDLLTYKKYKGVSLTDSGTRTALRIIRKHRLWEVFLVEKLQFKWHQVHDLAEQLEHIQSQELVNRLDDFLGNPQFDPHGDPIPDSDGNITRRNKKLLGQLAANQSATCIGVKSASDDFLKYLSKNNIGIGSKLYVVETEPYTGALTVKVAEAPIFLTQEIANSIYVTLIE
ncbi:metal-dependent transcriptional regulator [Gilvibacter sp.]|uniref:metal-dependent transcriptional regulator n=1 Tax=Gilvibacter sp. TaxID=2729997 RepID=UPI003F49B50C